ncbi:MAG: cytochrome c3 family protein [Anaerolineales bacterium]|nr:cytochrome c3 family protein [Anaerolineales bacterium]
MPYRRRPRPTIVLPRFVSLLLAVAGLGLAAGASGLFVAARLEEQDSFCASCHSEPEATFFQRSTAATAVDLASQHGHTLEARCIDCHSGAGLGGRLHGLQIGVSDLVPWVLGTARQPAPLTKPIPDENCLKCHADVPLTQAFNRHFHAFLPRWQALDRQAATCVDCHSAHTTDGQAEIEYLTEQRAVAVCQRCHTAAGEGG